MSLALLTIKSTVKFWPTAILIAAGSILVFAAFGLGVGVGVKVGVGTDVGEGVGVGVEVGEGVGVNVGGGQFPVAIRLFFTSTLSVKRAFVKGIKKIVLKLTEIIIKRIK